MPNELGLPQGDPARDEAPRVHVRTITLQPSSALGRLALGAAVIGAGALLVTVGLAIFATVAIAGAATGAGVLAYRAISRPRVPDDPPAARLDPSREVFLPPKKD